VAGVGSTALLLIILSLLASSFLLSYRRFPWVRARVNSLLGDPDWGRIQLWHILLPLTLLSLWNVAYNVLFVVHCPNDSIALLLSGQATRSGGDPFHINYCAGYDAIPYGLAQVAFDAVGSTGGLLGIWLIWQLPMLAIVPLAWLIGGDDRRYLTLLVSTSILYFPNLLSDISLDSAIVPLAAFLGIWAVGQRGQLRTWGVAAAAFLSTARFPALFSVLGACRTWPHRVLVSAVFAGCAALSFVLWGWDAINIVYLSQFSRTTPETFNLLAPLLQSGWLQPGTDAALFQGGVIVALLFWVWFRRYSLLASTVIPMLGVLSLSQFLTFHFFIWLLPIVLLYERLGWATLVYGTFGFLDQSIAYDYYGIGQGSWWLYDVLGVAIGLVLAYMLLALAVDEERARRTVPRQQVVAG
jgi:hypothetical protein